MKIHNLKKAHDLKVQKWLFESIPELTPYQKSRINDDEIVRWSPFTFMEETSSTKSVWWRLTILFLPVVCLSLIIGLPFNFILTGHWGYKNLKWFNNWLKRLSI